MVVMARYVLPGEAARRGASKWKTTHSSPHSSRRGDPFEVGRREIARDTFHNALRYGVWIEEDGLVRHRDWVPPVGAAGFVVPTLDELHGVGRLLTASDWERAAIVAAFVEPMNNGGDRRSISRRTATDSLTPNQFAALGIAGLKSDNTVRRYVEAWQSTGLPRPTPGEPVALPSEPFPKSWERPEGPPPAPSRSNDPIEWESWFIRAHKSAEFMDDLARRLAASAARQRNTLAAGRRIRRNNVIQMRKNA